MNLFYQYVVFLYNNFAYSFVNCFPLKWPRFFIFRYIFLTVAFNNNAICFGCVLMFVVRKIDGKFSLSFFVCGIVSNSCLTSSMRVEMSHYTLFGEIRIGNSWNKVEKGPKAWTMELEPRRGSRLACDASRKVGQWATGSVNAFLSSPFSRRMSYEHFFLTQIK